MTEFWLIIGLIFPSHATAFLGGKFANSDECLKALEKTQIVIPTGNADNEWAGFKTCLPNVDIKANFPMLTTGALK